MASPLSHSPPQPPTEQELPQLTVRIALPSELPVAFKLITDSIAQQRQTLNRSLILHPITLAFFSALVAVFYRKYDLPMLVIVAAGIALTLLAISKRLTVDYLERAEEVGTRAGLEKYLVGEDKEILVAIWGEEIIGAVVLKYPGKNKAEVWAWVVRLRYRGTGLGKDLLEIAVARARERQGKKCDIEFAEDHANSYRIGFIPKTYNSVFDRGDEKAQATLKEIIRNK